MAIFEVAFSTFEARFAAETSGERAETPHVT